MSNFLPKLSLKPVTASAFSIARYKIKADFFLDFNKWVTDILTTVPHKYWNGYRIIAGDGTTISVPVSKDTISHFGVYAQTSDGTKTVLANACILYDVLSEFVVDAVISGTHLKESTHIQTMLESFNISDSILVLDRGFSKFHFYKTLINKGLFFCIRQKTGDHRFSKYVLEHDEDDFITEWTPSKGEKDTCRIKGHDTMPIKVRVTKIKLPTGEIEVLISNIFNTSDITSTQMKELYHLRWQIEEAFKLLKPQMKLEQFGCKKTQGVYQEFYAQIIMMNIASLISKLAEKQIEHSTKKRKHKYKYNRKNAWKYIREKIIELYSRINFEQVLEDIIEKIARSIVVIVSERSYSREHKFKYKPRFSPMYK